jgi:hypothetical protein
MADIWPSSPIVVSDQVKQTITRFFDISDSVDPNSGRLFANEMFTEDGIFKTHKTMIFKGRDGTVFSTRYTYQKYSSIESI